MKSCLYKTLRGCHILVTYRVHFLRVCSELVHQVLQALPASLRCCMMEGSSTPLQVEKNTVEESHQCPIL